MPNKIRPCRGGTKWMHIHIKTISIFSTTPLGSSWEFKNFLSPDIIHLADSKELFLICLLLLSLRLCRPPAIIILTSLCFPGLIASRIQVIFCRRASKFVQKKSAAGDKEEKKWKQKHLPGLVHKYIYRRIPASRTNLLSPLSHQFSWCTHWGSYLQKPYTDFSAANSQSSLPSWKSYIFACAALYLSLQKWIFEFSSNQPFQIMFPTIFIILAIFVLSTNLSANSHNYPYWWLKIWKYWLALDSELTLKTKLMSFHKIVNYVPTASPREIFPFSWHLPQMDYSSLWKTCSDFCSWQTCLGS